MVSGQTAGVAAVGLDPITTTLGNQRGVGLGL